ncbi:hypothetical protein [Streptacidiphilus neutrinimicus]|uniref:hypothetical protein n=1 Tax=Streptacidiphilus neutrinimicus TaxID=105420 RepID=UPI0005A883A4|nr:hypothetical protein [Streptacidiphilus neutrinimicus]
MGKNTSVQARTQTVARAASDAADSLKTHAGHAARQAAEQARHTAGTLSARASHHTPPQQRSWPLRTGVAAACTLAAGALLWWLARHPAGHDTPNLPAQPIRPA